MYAQFAHIRNANAQIIIYRFKLFLNKKHA